MSDDAIKKWIASGKPIPAPVLYKTQTVIEYAVKYGTKVFIETGTNRGTTLGSVHHYFRDNYSIELSNMLYDYCKKIFANFERIHLHQGLSEEELPKILANIDEPALFWLDSHYSAGETAKGPTSSSLYKEIPAILSHKVQRHVLLIDDTYCCVDSDGYLSPETISKMILDKYPNYDVSIEGYILRAVPK